MGGGSLIAGKVGYAVTCAVAAVVLVVSGAAYRVVSLTAGIGGGIGISNVYERLRLLYGDQFEMDIRSEEGEGTHIRIAIPEVATVESAIF